MKQTPDAANLLAIARQTLLETVLPQVPADQRYAVLMVANAMAIATRDIGAPVDGRAEVTRIRACLPDAPDSPEDATRALAAAIRAGTFDTPTPEALALLQWLATTRVKISAPRALASAQGERS